MDGPKRTKRKRTTEEKKVRVRPDTVVKPAPVSVSPRLPKVNIQCLLGGAIIKDNGPETGVEYTFYPGKPTPVDSRDVDGLLARRTSRKRCCGNRSPEPQQMYGLA